MEQRFSSSGFGYKEVARTKSILRFFFLVQATTLGSFIIMLEFSAPCDTSSFDFEPTVTTSWQCYIDALGGLRCLPVLKVVFCRLCLPTKRDAFKRVMQMAVALGEGLHWISSHFQGAGVVFTDALSLSSALSNIDSVDLSELGVLIWECRQLLNLPVS